MVNSIIQQAYRPACALPLPNLNGTAPGLIAKKGDVEDRIKHLMQGSNPAVAPYAKTGEVHLRITVSAPSAEQAQAMTADMEVQIRERLGNAVYGVDEQTLEQAVMELLYRRWERPERLPSRASAG